MKCIFTITQLAIMTCLWSATVVAADTPQPFKKESIETRAQRLLLQLSSEDRIKQYNSIAELFDIAIDKRKDSTENEIFSNSRLRDKAVPLLIEKLTQSLKRKRNLMTTNLEVLGAASESIMMYIEVVGAFRDTRAVPVMLLAADEASVGGDALAKLGPPMLNALLKKACDPKEKESVQSNMIFCIEHIIKLMPSYGYKILPTQKEKTKSVLIMAIKELSGAKGAAIRGLGHLGDPDVIPLLEKIAKEDPFFRLVPAKDGKKGEKVKFYPTRQEAKKVLGKLRRKKKELEEKKKKPEPQQLQKSTTGQQKE